MIRPSTFATGLVCVLAAVSVGCAAFDSSDPHSANDVAAANAFHARQRAAVMRDSKGDARTDAASSARSKVRCRCDADGGLHVNAPAGAKVTLPENAFQEDAEAEIELEERRPGTPIRRTVSLGYVGDAPLTQVPSRGGPWNVPDALLPIHAHGDGNWGRAANAGIGYRGPVYGYGGYGGYGRGGGSVRSSGGGGGGGGATSAPSHNLHYTPHVHASGSAGSPGFGGGSARPGGGGGLR